MHAAPALPFGSHGVVTVTGQQGTSRTNSNAGVEEWELPGQGPRAWENRRQPGRREAGTWRRGAEVRRRDGAFVGRDCVVVRRGLGLWRAGWGERRDGSWERRRELQERRGGVRACSREPRPRRRDPGPRGRGWWIEHANQGSRARGAAVRAAGGGPWRRCSQSRPRDR
ncbi:Hypothetical protein A7982_01094 [Minicystis rosea]|nr:Hypothetical protein A7982_01094 [Minicystis rosea]